MAAAARAGGGATPLPLAAQTQQADSADEWEQTFTLLWIDLLESHGQAVESVAQLAVQTKSSSASHGFNDGFYNGGDDLSGVFGSSDSALGAQTQTNEEAVATLQEAMQNVSTLLSSVEEIIRERLVGNASASAQSAAVATADRGTMTLEREASSAALLKSRDAKQQTPNSLDAYLSGVALDEDDPAFVNSVRGWDATGAPIQVRASVPEVILLDGLELHNVMMQNNLRAASRAYGASSHAANGQSALSSRPRAPEASDKRAKKRKLSSAQQQQQQTADRPDRHAEPVGAARSVRKRIANLTAERVLQYRDGNHLCSYLVQWVDRDEPMWVLRKQCAPQTQQVIDEYNKKRFARTRRVNRQRAEEAADHQSSPGTAGGGGTDDGTPPQSSEDDIFIVDKIVGHRIRYGKKQYLVKWDGYDSSDNTWEAASKLQDDVADVVDAYERKVALAERQLQGATASVDVSEPSYSHHSSQENDKRQPQRRHSSDSEKTKKRRKHRAMMVKSAHGAADDSDDDDVEILSDRNEEDESSAGDLENEVVIVDSDDSESD